LHREDIKGRFALVESLAGDDFSILIFETPYSVTGDNSATVGCFGLGAIQDMCDGDTREANFNANTVLTFDEEIAARKSSLSYLLLGSYRGTGLLVDEATCDFVFSSNILPGEWRLGRKKDKRSRTGMLEKLFSQNDLVLERIG